MSYEVERKFRLPASQAFTEQVTRLGGTFSEPVVQIDRYFAHPSRDFAATDEALRIRTSGECSWLTYKGPKIDSTTKTRREIDISLVF